MADAPAPAKPKGRGGPLGVLTQKAGPLPVWAWAALLLGAFFLYRRLNPSGQTTGSTASGSSSGTDQAYVPPFDAASLSGGGGIGSTTTPGNVYNYYYGDQGAAQAGGGGTASGPITGTPAGPGTPGTSGGETTQPISEGINPTAGISLGRIPSPFIGSGVRTPSGFPIQSYSSAGHAL